MAWSGERKRFIGALVLFLAWVAFLAGLAAVSASRPAARTAPPDPPPDVTKVLGVP